MAHRYRAIMRLPWQGGPALIQYHVGKSAKKRDLPASKMGPVTV